MKIKLRNVLTIGTIAAVTASFAACSSVPTETSGIAETSAVAQTSAAPETSQTSIETESTAQMTEAASSYEQVELNSELQLNANTFITGFVEQYFPEYDRDTANIEQILDFIYLNLKLNSFESITYETCGDVTYETFTAEDVQSMASRYFGMLITDEISELPAPPETYGDQPQGPYYADGKVWYEEADGQIYNRIGIVNSIANPGDGTLILNFSVYTIDVDRYWSLTLDELHGLYTLTPDQADANDLLSLTTTGTATVGVSQSGEYYLIDYSVNEY